MSARRILVLAAVFVLLCVSVAAGFLFPREVSRTLIVDLRASPEPAVLTQTIAMYENPPVIIATGSQITDSCSVLPGAAVARDPAYCEALNRDPITLITEEPSDVLPAVVHERYGTDAEITGGKAFWVSTKTGFGPVASLVAFVITAVVLTTAVITVRHKRSSPNRVPAMREAVPVSQRNVRNPLPQPQMVGARSGGSPPPRQPARSPQPIRGIASELTPLVIRANRRAIARTHINSHGGYVSVGDVVVWAVLPPTEEGVVVPDDELDILGVDERAETLVVAPAGSPSSGRRPRP